LLIQSYRTHFYFILFYFTYQTSLQNVGKNNLQPKKETLVKNNRSIHGTHTNDLITNIAHNEHHNKCHWKIGHETHVHQDFFSQWFTSNHPTSVALPYSFPKSLKYHTIGRRNKGRVVGRFFY
jgi:hypothetical protein